MAKLGPRMMKSVREAAARASRHKESQVRWGADSRYPVTQILADCLKGKGRVKSFIKEANIVSPELGDHILQRIAPFLRRNAPMDILDLWPGPGLFSSQLNEFLRPRRHVMLEPDLKLWGQFLDPIAKGRECYKVVETNPYDIIFWDKFLSEHFPEQGPENIDNSGPLPRNDTLLVLANLPSPVTKRDHKTGSRFVSRFMEECLRQVGFHTYGAVRLLATLPQEDAKSMVPRDAGQRKRCALFTESVALHNIEVATHREDNYWVHVKGFTYVKDERRRVTEEASARGFAPIPGRDFPPLVTAPDVGHLGRFPHKLAPYEPRILTDLHSSLLETIQKPDNMSPDEAGYREASLARGRAITRINIDNGEASLKSQITRKYVQVDELSKSVARLAARATTTRADLEPLVSEMATLKQAIDDDIDKLQTKHTPQVRSMHDDIRCRPFNDMPAVLSWDRRPFEPLLIETHETYPRGDKCSIVYFEPDSNSPVAEKYYSLDIDARKEAFDLFEAFSLAQYRGRKELTFDEMLSLIFPGRSTNDCVRAIPSLAQHAVRTPKPDFDSLPKTVIPAANPGGGGATTTEPDPAVCYQENLDYDLTDVRMQGVSCSVLWDICIAYATYEQRPSITQLNRALGATLTVARVGSDLESHKRLH
ncbi:uncharacterized protein BP01DRAFT_414171 [Aspergillus saccharolyticus JOP 1030-1]|uniref:rRNA adenine N(6)-methyltransferase n=1 Tax=Aspergillus saccharolyticus JOP 1030-1 TaxID=1450539 RepID=A0A318ZMI9_9EURO|nr:S-adenosyl-L-methionine-dependent methyltransferase [Aspergillus saccharolyticus JOP 1030-1]PYH47895.1 S-adenosyl-L-methionine-dependent methyltransferase [Aspergillus saccharolyticus JOP 1030-1]